MADPFIQADAATAMAAGQWIITNKAKWSTKQLTLAECALTIASFGAPFALKDQPDVTPIGGEIPPSNLGEVHDSLKAIQKEMVAPQAAGVSTFVFPFLPLLIQVAITILQQLLGRTS